jgi:CRISPR-associated endonuclease/helicase Cas3
MDQHIPIAHVSEDGRCHRLQDHLLGTASRARQMAAEFNAAEWGYLAGLWHDLGKLSQAFQGKIRAAADPEAHIETKQGRVDHSTAGAIWAVERMNGPGRVLAYLAAGHHAGLPDWQSEEAGNRALAERLKRKELLSYLPLDDISKEIFSPPNPTKKPPLGADPALWIRMLFSCLVDADFLDTEEFMDPEKAERRAGYPVLTDLLPQFREFMEGVRNNAPPTPVNEWRAAILDRCIAASALPPGIFTLTVPTGGGKTLSSMAFGLNHAATHGKRRIIYVIPYTSIIEQTADQFRRIFGDSVVEHHCNFDGGGEEGETSRSRLACENWDAPVIVTTSVQFFESLFAVRTSRCRKLHNIVNSVVVLDEAQLLPPEFLRPILRVIAELRKNYGVTFVLSTATQPAFSPIETPSFRFEGLSNMTEIVNDPGALHGAFRRVTVHVPEDLYAPCAWEDLAAELSAHPSILCIVNRRDDCRRLFEAMPEGTIHLSALMCGAHRTERITEIKGRLKNGIPTRVISTQLVEAGVDLDFPVVYRALAGLDSIAQAAGRCNREGGIQGLGKVVVFIPPSEAPPGHLRQASEKGRQLLAERTDDPLSPARFSRFFRELYWLKGDGLDRHDILGDLQPGGSLEIRFRTAAGKFHIINEAGQAPVLVRHGDGGKLIDTLVHKGPERWLLRKLQRYTVNLPRQIHTKLVDEGGLLEISPGLFVQAHGGLYHEELGFCPDRSAAIPPDDLLI